MRRFAGIELVEDAIPDESTILRFRHLLEEHKLTEAIFAEVRSLLEEKRLLLKSGTNRQLMAHGRNVCPDPWPLVLSVSRGRQAGGTIDFFLRPDRGAAARASCAKAVDSNGGRHPRKITIDGHVPSRRALWLLRRENVLWRYVNVRTCKYLNNIVEQEHRAIKRRCSVGS